MAAYQAALDGYQSAVMVPTEVLAAQHFATMTKLLSSTNVKIGLLTGAIKGKARRELLDRIAEGEIQLVIGTHALFQPAVQFRRVSLFPLRTCFGVRNRFILLGRVCKSCCT